MNKALENLKAYVNAITPDEGYREPNDMVKLSCNGNRLTAGDLRKAVEFIDIASKVEELAAQKISEEAKTSYRDKQASAADSVRETSVSYRHDNPYAAPVERKHTSEDNEPAKCAELDGITWVKECEGIYTDARTANMSIGFIKVDNVIYQVDSSYMMCVPIEKGFLSVSLDYVLDLIQHRRKDEQDNPKR